MFAPNMDSLGCQPFKGVNWALVLGLYLRDVIKGPALVLGLLLNPFLSLAFGLVFCAYAPIILNPINFYLLLFLYCYLEIPHILASLERLVLNQMSLLLIQ